jgi:hypothetical protein
MSAGGPGSRKQTFFNAMQAFPCGFGQCWISTNDIADHIPGGEVERAFGRGTHGEGNRALRAETDALRGGFLPGPYSHGLGEEIDGNRFLSGLEFPIATKTIQVVQDFLPQSPQKSVLLLWPRRWHWHKYVEGFPSQQ